MKKDDSSKTKERINEGYGIPIPKVKREKDTPKENIKPPTTKTKK